MNSQKSVFAWPKQIKVILLKKVNMIRSPFVILGFFIGFSQFFLNQILVSISCFFAKIETKPYKTTKKQTTKIARSS